VTIIIPDRAEANYTLTLTASDEMPCPNQCSGRGECQKGTCICLDGYIDEDCSQKAQRIQLGHDYFYNDLIFSYFYYEPALDQISGVQLKAELNSSYQLTLYCEQERTQYLFLPSEQEFDYVSNLNKFNPTSIFIS
jgi:hypothetical protein